ncbi:MAG TPA: phytanoyl-CoA dioxygenase family protein [Acetobacteraceae bacterium]
MPDEQHLPPLDRTGADSAALAPEQQSWCCNGFVILPRFIPDAVLDPYIERRSALNQPGGWVTPTPYLQVPELRRLALYSPLMHMLRDLVGEEMLLHLNLTGWVSTERNWHQDDYLNPPFVNSWYAAVWIALDTIDPRSGPFEYVPGSHRWGLLRGEKVRRFLTEEELARRDGPLGLNHWEKYSERFVVPAIEREIEARGIPPERFLGSKGDVLIWHGRLIHRGTAPAEPGLPRKSLIGHYSGLSHRPDMAERARDENGMWYAVFDLPLT